MNSHVLPNGYTFLAMSQGFYGFWEKAADPITAIKNVVRAEGRHGKAIPVAVMYGKNDSLNCNAEGGFTWKRKAPPTPIGLFKATSRSIKPLSEGDCGSKGIDHERWMTSISEEIEEYLEYFNKEASE